MSLLSPKVLAGVASVESNCAGISAKIAEVSPPMSYRDYDTKQRVVQLRAIAS